MLFDAHAHINSEQYEEDRGEIIAAIEGSPLDYVMDVGFDFPSSQRAVEDSRKWPWCYAAVGVHPHDTDKMDEAMLEEIGRMALLPKVQAIGEIGLDFHYDLSPRDVQEHWFRRQLQLALALKKPIIIHSREADALTMDILVSEGCFSDARKADFPPLPDGEPDARVLLHCFSGSAEMAAQYIRLGAHLSLAGPLTFKNNKKTVAVAETVPLSRLLVETDSPYLTPEPHRGARNMPPYVEHTARKLADIKGISFEEAAAAAKANALRFYGITG